MTADEYEAKLRGRTEEAIRAGHQNDGRWTIRRAAEWKAVTDAIDALLQAAIGGAGVSPHTEPNPNPVPFDMGLASKLETAERERDEWKTLAEELGAAYADALAWHRCPEPASGIACWCLSIKGRDALRRLRARTGDTKGLAP